MRRKKLVTLIGSVCLILVLSALPFMTACPAPAEEEGCVTDADCPEGYICVNGACVLEEEPVVDTAAEFYEGKTVILTAGPAGSGVDVGARLFAKYFEEVTGARVLVENYSEVGGLKAINVAYAAEADGLTIGCHTLSTVFQNRLLDEPAAMYDLDKLIYIGSSVMAPMALWVQADGPYNTLEKLIEGTDLLQAGGSPLGYMAFWGSLAAHFLEMDFGTILGLGGPPQCKLAVMRGECQFTNIAIHTAGIAPDLTPVVLITEEGHYLLPDVPAIAEVIDLTDEQRQLLSFAIVGSNYSGAGFVFPPGVPQDRVEYVRQVWNEISTRTDFVEEAISILRIWGSHTAEEVEQTVQFCLDNKATFEEIRDLVTSYYR